MSLKKNKIIDNCVIIIKNNGHEWVQQMLERDLAYTKLGSLSYLFFGSKPSEQSLNIKLGYLGEFITKELIKSNSKFSLLRCGIQNINSKRKDVDLIFENKLTKTIFYRELKSNIQLDTEKLSATVTKCKDIQSYFTVKYPEHYIDFGILNWSIYDRHLLTAGLSNIKSFEKNGIKIDHMNDLLCLLDIIWPKADFYAYFRELGTMVNSHFE